MIRRIAVSVSQLCEQLEIDPRTFVAVENGRWEAKPDGGKRWVKEVQIVVEQEARA